MTEIDLITDKEKQEIMDKYGQKLKVFLRHIPMDSIRLKIDSISTSV